MTTLTECLKITRSDGVIIGMTSLDQDLTIAGVLYRSISGYTPSSIDQGRDMSVSNLDLQGLLDSTGIVNESDLIAGKYDNARVHIFNYDYIAAVVVESDIFNGYLGDVSIKNGMFNAEIRSFHQFLKNDLTQKYSPTCRAELGDEKCQKSLTGFTFTGTVTSVVDRSSFTDSTKAQAAGYFKYGVLTWTSGLNNGLKMAVAEFSSSSFRLFISSPQNIIIGDAFGVIAGCDKQFATCKNTFNNVINFRGERPFLGVIRLCCIPMLDNKQLKIMEAARYCLGTPWQHQGRLPGVGLDCIGVLCHVAQCIGMPYRDQVGYGRMPRPEVLLPALSENLTQIIESEALPGDIILMRCPYTSRPLHLGIISDYGIIHAHYDSKRVVETVIDDDIANSIIAWYRFK